MFSSHRQYMGKYLQPTARKHSTKMKARTSPLLLLFKIAYIYASLLLMLLMHPTGSGILIEGIIVVNRMRHEKWTFYIRQF